MEAKPCDPYEQQLFSVFESCLEPGDSHLTASSLRSLCDKLQLEERGEDLISSLLPPHSLKTPKISFTDFKNALVTFLGTEESPETISKSPTNSREKHGHWSTSLESQRLRQLCYKFNGSMNGSREADPESPDVHHLPKHILESLFSKLDLDCDGLINFSDFMMLFQNSRDIDFPDLTDLMDFPGHDTSHEKIPSILGPDHTGFLDKTSIIALWELAGVSNGKS